MQWGANCLDLVLCWGGSCCEGCIMFLCSLQNEYMKDDFFIKIETWHKPDLGTLENVSFHTALQGLRCSCFAACWSAHPRPGCDGQHCQRGASSVLESGNGPLSPLQ